MNRTTKSFAAAIAFSFSMAGCTPSGTTLDDKSHRPASVSDEELPSGESPKTTPGTANVDTSTSEPSELTSDVVKTSATREESAPSSAFELVEAVLAAVEAKDRSAIDALRIDKSEYAEVIYPGFGKKMNQLSIQWLLLDKQSVVATSRLIGEYMRRKPRLISVDWSSVDNYEGYELLRGVKVVCRIGGEEEVIDAFGSIVVMDGAYKMLSFKD